MPSLDDVQAWQGRDVVDSNGDKIGKLEDVYLDRDSGEPEWAAIKTGLFGSKLSFAPLRDASDAGEEIRIPYSKDQVKDAPKIDADGELSVEEEQQLYRHYGRGDYGDWDPTTDRTEAVMGREEGFGSEGGAGTSTAGTTATTGTTSDYETRGAAGDYETGETTDEYAGRETTAEYRGGETTGEYGRGETTGEYAGGTTGEHAGGGTTGEYAGAGTTDEAMTRSEEELRVGTARRESGRARLRKYVVTENVTETVPVEREEVRIEREPITDDNREAAMGGPDISEAEHEITLHSEEAVVEKRTVPKERVRLDKESVADEETVSEDVRKERIEGDGDAEGRL